MVIWQDAAQNRVYYYHKWAYYLKCLFLLTLTIYLLWKIFFGISRFGLEKKINLTKNTKNSIIFRMPFGSEFHLSHLRQSLHLPSGIGMAFSRTPFGSEFHLSRLRQSVYLPSGIGMAFSSQTWRVGLSHPSKIANHKSNPTNNLALIHHKRKPLTTPVDGFFLSGRKAASDISIMSGLRGVRGAWVATGDLF